MKKQPFDASVSKFDVTKCKNIEPINQDMSPKGQMEPSVVTDRINRYKNEKNALGNYANNISFHPCAVLQLLRNLTDKTKNYSGLRIYFGADPVKPNTLMLVFVFTKREEPEGYRIHQDDRQSCFIIQGETAQNITDQQASIYVNAYLEHAYKEFKRDGQRKYEETFPENPNAEFVETISLWYNVSLFWPGKDLDDDKTGLVTYLQYLINKNEIDNVVIDLGGFEHTPKINWFYQLTLIFNFTNKGEPIYTFTGSYSKEAKKIINRFSKKGENVADEEFISILRALQDSGYANTGVPCPPPPSGTNTCGHNGSLLPLP